MVLRQNVSYDVYGTFCMESVRHSTLSKTCHGQMFYQRGQSMHHSMSHDHVIHTAARV